MPQSIESSTTIPVKKVRRKTNKKAVWKIEPMDFRVFLDGSESNTSNTDYIAVSVTARMYELGYSLMVSNLGADVVDVEKRTVIHGIVSDKNEYARESNRLFIISHVAAVLLRKIEAYVDYNELPTWSYKKFLNRNLYGSNAACAAICTKDKGFEFVLSDCNNVTRLSFGDMKIEEDKAFAIKRINVIIDAINTLVQSIRNNYMLNIG